MLFSKNGNGIRLLILSHVYFLLLFVIAPPLINAVIVKTEVQQKEHSLELSSKSPIVIEKAFSLLHLQQDSKHRNIKGDRSSAPPHLRLTGRHFPSQVPPRGNKKCAVRRCYVCQHTTKNPQRRKESRYMCKECDKGLCVYPCFETYHSELNF